MKKILLSMHHTLISGIQHLYYNLYKYIVYKKTGSAEHRAEFILYIFLIAIVFDFVILVDTLIHLQIRHTIPFVYFIIISAALWPYSHIYTVPKFKEIEKRYKSYTPGQRQKYAGISFTVAVGSLALLFFLVELGKYLRN